MREAGERPSWHPTMNSVFQHHDNVFGEFLPATREMTSYGESQPFLGLDEKHLSGVSEDFHGDREVFGILENSQEPLTHLTGNRDGKAEVEHHPTRLTCSRRLWERGQRVHPKAASRKKVMDKFVSGLANYVVALHEGSSRSVRGIWRRFAVIRALFSFCP